MFRRLVALLAAAFVSISLSVVMAAPAQALPTGCSTRIATWQTQAFTTCSGGTGYMKTAIICRNILGWSAYRESAWVHIYWLQSHATCPAGYWGTNAYHMLKN